MHGATVCCGAPAAGLGVCGLFSDFGGRHSSCVSVMVLQLHALLWRVVGKARVNVWCRRGLGCSRRSLWVCDVGVEGVYDLCVVVLFIDKQQDKSSWTPFHSQSPRMDFGLHQLSPGPSWSSNWV